LVHNEVKLCVPKWVNNEDKLCVSKWNIISYPVLNEIMVTVGQMSWTCLCVHILECNNHNIEHHKHSLCGKWWI